jgi:hypothetical protein
LPNIIKFIKSRRMRQAGHVAHVRENRNAYGVVVGNHEGKRPHGRPRHSRQDNSKMDLKEAE